MHSTFELYSLSNKPKINKISLHTLCEYYELYLSQFIFVYDIVYLDGKKQNIELRFDCENFCHLLGIESIAKYSVKRSKLHNYKGQCGWDNIKRGLIDFTHLKSLNQRQFKNVKAKYVYFYLLPHLLDSPLGIEYDKSKVIPPTNIDCELMFYSSKDNAVVHLGIEKEDENQYYIPRTFFIEKLSSHNSTDIYTYNQSKIEIQKKEQIIML